MSIYSNGNGGVTVSSVSGGNITFGPSGACGNSVAQSNEKYELMYKIKKCANDQKSFNLMHAQIDLSSALLESVADNNNNSENFIDLFAQTQVDDALKNLDKHIELVTKFTNNLKLLVNQYSIINVIK